MSTVNIYAYPHEEVRRAVEAGILVRPDRCSECGRIRKVVAHHDDYAKPEDVRWLCRTCHSLWHRANGPGVNRHLKKSYSYPPSVPRLPKKTRPPKEHRRPDSFDEMAALRKDGWTLEKIGQRFGVTRERVRQIIGTTHKPRQQKDTAFDRCTEVLAAWESGDTPKEIKDRFGLSAEQFRLYEFPKRPKRITHGVTGYNRGCRCDVCRSASSARMKQRQHRLREMGLCVDCMAPSQSWVCAVCRIRRYGLPKERIAPRGKSGIPGIAVRTNGHYVVVRYAGGKQLHFGSFADIEAATAVNNAINSSSLPVKQQWELVKGLYEKASQ